MNAIELLSSAAEELKSYIDKENERLKAGITSTDLEPPTYHDYQTCYELMLMARGIEAAHELRNARLYQQCNGVNENENLQNDRKTKS